jgi:NADP-dependent 3-hydroxy acid dehydrogenase YdfG
MLGSKIFTTADQQRFALQTGDYNPMHMDPIAARRTQAGAPVVHGIHTLLWMLDELCAQHGELAQAAALKVRFPKVIYVGDRVEARIVQRTATLLRAQACVDAMVVVSVTINLGPIPVAPPSSLCPSAALLEPRHVPADLTLQEMKELTGRISFAMQIAAMQSAFPDASRLLGAQRIAAIGCSSYLVGMIVPGLHSIYGGLELQFTTNAAPADELHFAVTAVDACFRRVQLSIAAAGLSASLTTFSRIPPVSQPPMNLIAEQVARDEFTDSIALVVGGSRGLGELTAKLVAAGGGRVIVTYASGKADADKLAAQINDWGGNCEVVAYDVRQDAQRQFEALPQAPSHLYYFATPTISRRKSGLCERDRLEEFHEFYVHGFLRVVQAGMLRAPEGLAVFYPSSVFVQERPQGMTEYAMAKSAGEILCADLARNFKKLRLLTERLPRLSTDQTASLIPTAGANSLSVMLPIVRRMHQRIPADAPSLSMPVGPAIGIVRNANIEIR